MRRSPQVRLLTVSSTAVLLVLAVLAPAAALGSGTGGEVVPSAPAAESVIVTFDDRRAAAADVREIAEGAVTALAPDVVAVEVDDAAAAVDALADVDGIRHVEPDWPLTLSTLTPPDDPHFGLQWALHNTGQSTGSAGADIAALAAWDILAARSASDVVVAIADSGIDGAHPDLSARMWRNDGAHSACPVGSTGYDFVQGTCATGGTDPHGHGTHVAGTVGAAVGNGIGVAGVAPNARLLDLRIMDSSGAGSTSHAVAAVNLATSLAQHGVPLRVLNASWGGTHQSAALRDAIAAAGAAGILVVAAAGNAAADNDVTPTYPCAYPLTNIVCVAASTRNDQRATYSNYGRTTVDLAAPGSAIASTWPGGVYAWLDGTSMAAPHVTGVAAMLAGSCTTGVTGMREALLASVDLLPAFATTTASGGRVDAAAALAASACGSLQPPGAPGPALIGPTNPVISWTAGGGDRFTLQRANPGGATWDDVATGLTEPRFDVSAVPDGRMDLRVVATRGGATALSPVTSGAVIDRTAPSVVVTGCPTAEIVLGSMVQVAITASDAGSGLAVDPSGTHTLDTSELGTLTAAFAATDRVALSTTSLCTYTVASGPTGGGGGAATPSGSVTAQPDDGAEPTSPDGAEPTSPDGAEPTSPDGEQTPEGQDDAGTVAPVAPVQAPARIDAPNAPEAALVVSRLRFTGTNPPADDTARAAHHAVLARDDQFADALAGASLTTRGPLLLTSATGLDPATAEELERVLPPGGTVYLLGGDGALQPSVEASVRALGLVPQRLAGPSRIETALRIADEVRALNGPGAEVLVARAYGPADNPTASWADAISGGAYGAATGTPVVLSPSDVLHPSVAQWLAAADSHTILLGGAAALSEEVAGALPGSTRVAGTDRAATAAAVATQLWGLPVPLEGATLVDGWDADGWAYGLAAAGLAADLHAPLLVVGSSLPPATAAVLGCTTTTIVGGFATVGAPVAADLDELCAG